jgi:kynurenine formamidase
VKQTTVSVKSFFVTESEWLLETNHLGTHIDVPKHFIRNGISLSDFEDSFWFFNNVQVIDIPCDSGRLIEFSEVENKIIDKEKIELLLIRTGYEKYRTDEKYWRDNPGISSDCAEKIISEFPKLRGVGFDFISLTSYNFRDEGKQAHYNLLKNNLPFIIIEDMKLSVAPKGEIDNLIISPLFIENADGAPVSVFLI